MLDSLLSDLSAALERDDVSAATAVARRMIAEGYGRELQAFMIRLSCAK